MLLKLYNLINTDVIDKTKTRILLPSKNKPYEAESKPKAKRSITLKLNTRVKDYPKPVEQKAAPTARIKVASRNYTLLNDNKIHFYSDGSKPQAQVNGMK